MSDPLFWPACAAVVLAVAWAAAHQPDRPIRHDITSWR